MYVLTYFFYSIAARGCQDWNVRPVPDTLSEQLWTAEGPARARGQQDRQDLHAFGGPQVCASQLHRQL